MNKGLYCCLTLLLLAVLIINPAAADETVPYAVVETVVIDSSGNPTPFADSPGTAQPQSQEALREKATELLPVPNDSMASSILGNIRFDSGLAGLETVLTTTSMPYISVLGEALYYILLFGIQIVLIWVGSGSVKIPAIVGLGFSGFAMTFLPNAWQATIMVLIAVIITTGILFLWVRRQEV